MKALTGCSQECIDEAYSLRIRLSPGSPADRAQEDCSSQHKKHATHLHATLSSTSKTDHNRVPENAEVVVVGGYILGR